MKRILAIAFILALAGGYWFMQNRDRFFPKPVATEVAPQRWQVGTGQPAPVLPVQETVNATVVAPEGNATAQGNATAPVLPADEIVRHEFIEDLSHYMVDCYLPGGTKKNPGSEPRFVLNVKSVNIRYGVDFNGLNVDPADTLGARKVIFSHVLKEPVLDFLHAAYTPLFLDSLERALQSTTYTLPSGQMAVVSEAQRKEMLNLLAARLKTIGKTVSTLARTDSIRLLVTKYLEDMESVSQAHLAFWNMQGQEASISAKNEASARIKTTIQTREISRQRLLQAIVSASNPQGMDASELIYLAQWVHRRSLEDPNGMGSIAKAGELLVRTAEAVQERALEPQPEVEQVVTGNETQNQGQ
ncbi:MAG: hypothetical protein CVU60_08240 [Deltaproteobacteria bacterium HGW-Deltaproteobacteria-18]|nr:MAG: hypothetical protein CVU60_08240 [Deltaproteobacteria bacterium HGW-Deltaproteobacteria-18]